MLRTTDRRRILLFTDAWAPQVNGVVRTLESVVARLRAAGDRVRVVHPGGFRTLPCPTYPDIRLARAPSARVRSIADEERPDAVHVATEGPIGLAARRMCIARGWPFTTSFHTRFPEYVRARLPVPTDWTYRAVRWFHRPAERVLVPTDSMRAELALHAIRHTVTWSRGVDVERFRPELRTALGLPRPIHLYVGRLAVEKNLPAFLGLDLPGTKLVVGDGPAAADLRRAYRGARFVGAKHGDELATLFASADVFVFPSRTDTFGLVLLEALASGVPVAAFPVPGPRDVLAGADAAVGALDEDLARACARALVAGPHACRAHALRFSWARCAARMRENLAPIDRRLHEARDRRVRASGFVDEGFLPAEAWA